MLHKGGGPQRMIGPPAASQFSKTQSELMVHADPGAPLPLAWQVWSLGSQTPEMHSCGSLQVAPFVRTAVHVPAIQWLDTQSRFTAHAAPPGWCGEQIEVDPTATQAPIVS